MSPRALTCSQCNAPMDVGPFARKAHCSYCGSTVLLDGKRPVRAEVFRRAHRTWSRPDEADDRAPHLTLDGRRWHLGPLLARGEVSDVHLAERVRRPPHRVLLKVLRDPAAADRFDHEWRVLERLERSSAPGAAVLSLRVPRPIARGEIGDGPHAGSRALVLDWSPAHRHTFEDVRRQHPDGIEPRAAIWVWRRALEILHFVHSTRLVQGRPPMVHGAVLPCHLLVERGEHGLRLVGFGTADVAGSPWRPVPASDDPFVPRALGDAPRLTPGVDLAMSARSVAFLLGGDPASGSLPDRVPEPLAEAVASHGAWGGAALPTGDAWSLREELGHLARRVFGKPAFCPIPMTETSPRP